MRAFSVLHADSFSFSPPCSVYSFLQRITTIVLLVLYLFSIILSLLFLHICLLSTFRQRIQFTRVLLINSRIQTMDIKLLLFKFVYLSSFCMDFILCVCVCAVPKILLFYVFKNILYSIPRWKYSSIYDVSSCIGWKWLIGSCMSVW